MWGAGILLLSLAPCGMVCFRGDSIGDAITRGFLSSAAAVRIAILTLSRPNLAGAAERAFAPVRRIQSGEVGDYAASLIAGVACLGGLFLALPRR